jgi:hypothetical protein
MIKNGMITNGTNEHKVAPAIILHEILKANEMILTKNEINSNGNTNINVAIGNSGINKQGNLCMEKCTGIVVTIIKVNQ